MFWQNGIKNFWSRILTRSRITCLGEFYQEVDKLITDLNRGGFQVESVALEDAMKRGNTGSEIMGEIRIELRRLRKELPASWRKQVNELLHWINWH